MTKLSQAFVKGNDVYELNGTYPLDVLNFFDLSKESVGEVKSLAENFNNDVFETLNQAETQYFLALKRYEKKYGTLDYAPKFSEKFHEAFDECLGNKHALENSKLVFSDWLENPRDGIFFLENLDGQVVEKFTVFKNFDIKKLEHCILEAMEYSEWIDRFVFRGVGEKMPRTGEDRKCMMQILNFLNGYENFFSIKNKKIIAAQIFDLWKFKKESFVIYLSGGYEKEYRLDSAKMQSPEVVFNQVLELVSMNNQIKNNHLVLNVI